MPYFSNQNVPWLAPCCACRASNAGPLQLLLSTGLHGWWGEEELYQALQEATSVKVGLWLTNWRTIASWVFTSVAPDASLILLIEQILYRLYTFILIHLTSLYISLHLLFYSVPPGLNSASATTAQQLRLSNYASATTPQQLRTSNYASATTTQQPRLSNHGSATKLGSRFSNHASATKIYSRFSNQTSATKTHPLWQAHTKSHLTRHIKFPLLWQVHAKSHLTRHIKIPPPLASTCKVTSYTSYQIPNPLWQAHAKSHLTRHIKVPLLWQVHAQSRLTRHIKIQPPLANTCKVLQSHILHVISKSQPLWEVHAKSHLTRHIKIPPPLASTCTVTSYITRSKSHPLWQAHARSHLTRHIKIPPPLASTCTVSSYTFTDLGLRIMVYEPWFTSHGLRSIVYEPWFTEAGVKPHRDPSGISYIIRYIITTAPLVFLVLQIPMAVLLGGDP